MRISRRGFLGSLGAVGAAVMASRLRSGKARAATPGDYKALVCVFLFGGNDGNNFIVPMDTAGYQKYTTVRPVVSGGLGLDSGDLKPLTPLDTGQYGFHPSLGD